MEFQWACACAERTPRPRLPAAFLELPGGNEARSRIRRVDVRQVRGDRHRSDRDTATRQPNRLTFKSPASGQRPNRPLDSLHRADDNCFSTGVGGDDRDGMEGEYGIGRRFTERQGLRPVDDAYAGGVLLDATHDASDRRRDQTELRRLAAPPPGHRRRLATPESEPLHRRLENVAPGDLGSLAL